MATQREDLKLETDESFQRNEWRIQRAGWIVWSLVIIAGLIGLLGSGPRSHQETAAENQVRTQLKEGIFMPRAKKHSAVHRSTPV